VVGVMDRAGSSGSDSLISSGFYQLYRSQLVGPVNAMVDLRDGTADFDQFRRDVDRLMGRPVNVESAEDLFGVRKTRNVSGVEAPDCCSSHWRSPSPTASLSARRAAPRVSGRRRSCDRSDERTATPDVLPRYATRRGSRAGGARREPTPRAE
jgi:hypothetical protein